MSLYDIDFLKEFSNCCREIESAERRSYDAEVLMKFVHQLYDDTFSGKLPPLLGNNPTRWTTPREAYTGDVIVLLSDTENDMQRAVNKFSDFTDAYELAVDTEKTKYLEDVMRQCDKERLSLLDNKEKAPVHEVLDIFRRTVIEKCCNHLSGFTFGCVMNSSSFQSSLAQTLAAWFPVAPTWYTLDPGSCELELSVINWFCDLVGYGKDACGYLTSGASAATVHGLMTAREDLLDNGIYVSPERCVAYVSEMTHRSNKMALKVIGLRKCHVRKIQVDDNFCMMTYRLEERIKEDIKAGLKPFVVVGTAGTTDAGSVDPLIDIVQIAKAYGLWFHVDAALGGVCMITENGKKLLKGIELSDSATLDGHKLLFQPPGLGVILVRDGKKLRMSMTNDDDPYYIRDEYPGYSPIDYTFEMTRPLRGISLWFSLKVLGEDFYRKVITEKLQLTQYTVDKLNQIPVITVYGKSELMIVLYRYEPPNCDLNDVNSKFIIKLKNQERMYNDATVIDGTIYQRLCFTSHRTHVEEVDELIESIKENISSLQ